ncbi:MAG: hypothetical protein CVV27_06770, partial [Candidatus Melainabacteria bacterium HGW-Melainabacteria-1]
LIGRASLAPAGAFLAALGIGAFGSLLLTRFTSRILGAMFRESTTATSPEELLGCVGEVISGQVPEAGGELKRTASFGRAHVYTSHGTLLQIPCVAHPGCRLPLKREPVFVTGYDPERRLYTVLVHESEDYVAYLHGHAGEMARFESRLQKSLRAREARAPEPVQGPTPGQHEPDKGV